MSKKIFISQPMGCKTNEQIKLEREQLTSDFEKIGYEVLDTVFDLEKEKSSIYYLAESIKYLDKADVVVFMQGWDKARGCKIEFEVAKEYNKTILLI